MKTFGFSINNDAFEKNSWYFRNALVRANYNDLQNGVHATTRFLEMFFSNLILGTEYELKNRYMHVDYVNSKSQSVNSKVPKSQFDTLECTLLHNIAILEKVKDPEQRIWYIQKIDGRIMCWCIRLRGGCISGRYWCVMSRNFCWTPVLHFWESD